MRNLKKIHEGFTLLEIVMGMAITAVAFTSIMKFQKDQTEDNLNSVTAQYQSILTKASQKYISDNYDAVLAVATATTPAVITVSMLKTTKYLPSSFGDVGPRGQTYQLYAIEPSSNKLESILVSSGGPTISDKNLVQIANKAGATAGYVLSSAPGTVKGVYGSWSTALSNYKIGNNAGHLASALFFTDGQVDNDYLYRSAVSGHPEVNRMNTAIDLNGNDLNNVNTTNTTTLKSTTTNTSAETYTGGWFRTTGDGGVYFSKYGGGWYMNNTSTISAYGNKNVQTAGGLYGGYVNSTGNIDASGSISANGNVTGNGTVTGGNVYSRSNVQAAGNVLANGYLYSGLVAAANTSCPANGAVAREANGGPLFCQSGVWQKTGGGVTRVCANRCGSNWPVEIGRVNHDGDWSSWYTLGEGCSGAYTANWQIPVFCSVN